MATSMDSEADILRTYISQIKSPDINRRLKSLRRTRDFIRDKRGRSRIGNFRDIGGLEILVKLLREVVNEPTKVCTDVNAKFTVDNTNSSLGPTAKPKAKAKSARCKRPSHKKDPPKSTIEGLSEAKRLEYLNMCISILATCCTEPDSKQKVKDSGCIIILGKLLRNEKDEGVINRTARAVANLAKVPEFSEVFHKLDFTPCLIELLKKSEDVYTRYSLVRSLRLLADTSDHRLSIIDHGGVKAVLESLKSEDINLIGIAIETATEMTQPYLFNHLKKPNWRALWETIGDQATEAVAPLLKLLDEAKESVAQQALALLNNLMNSRVVRLAVGSCDKIPDFVRICGELEHANFLPYLQCLALCCKESVNRAKVKSGNGLDIFLKVLQSSSVVLQGKHVAVAGLVHFYHDDLALRYLCFNDFIGGLAKYLSEYIERDLNLPSDLFHKPVYEWDSTIAPAIKQVDQCVETDTYTSKDELEKETVGPGDLGSVLQTDKGQKKEKDIEHLSTHGDPEVIRYSKKQLRPSDDDELSSDPQDGTSCGVNLPVVPSSSGTSASSHTMEEATAPEDEECMEVAPFPPIIPSDLISASTLDSDTSVPVAASSPISPISEDMSDEYSMFLDQSPAPYSPPRVDWSRVFACREQQGYRGLSPQSVLSWQSDSLEREPPKYQYASEWPMSPMSDGSWTLAEEGEGLEGEVQYSPVVSEAEDQEESEEQEESVPPVLEGAPVEPTSTVASTSGIGPDNIQHSTTTLDLEKQPSALPGCTPGKRARSPSIDSSYESEILDDVPSDDGSCKPEGYALHLLLKCSHIDETLERVATCEVIDVLLKLALHSTQFKERSTRILNRVLSSRLVFETLVKEGVPQFLSSSWEKYHVTYNCTNGKEKGPQKGMPDISLSEAVKLLDKKSSKSQEKRGKRSRLDDANRGNRPDEDEVNNISSSKDVASSQSNPEVGTCPFLERLIGVADGSFGRGVMSHLVHSRMVREKMAAFDSLSVLCRSRTSLRHHLRDGDVVPAMVNILRSRPSDENVSIVVRLLQKLCRAADIQSVVTVLQERTIDATTKHERVKGGTCHTKEGHSSMTGADVSSKCVYQSSKEPTDLQISLDGEEDALLTNRGILCRKSDYFRVMFSGSYREASESKIRIGNVRKTVLELVIHYVYGCQWRECSVFKDISMDTGLELLSTAGRLLLHNLQETVTKCCLEYQVTASTVSAVCIYALNHNCLPLFRFCLKFILSNEDVVSSTFVELLKDPHIDSVLCEMRSIVKEAVRLL